MRWTALRAAATAVLVIAGGGSARPAMAAGRPPNPVSAVDQVAELVASAARRFSIPETWIYAVMQAESAGEPHAVSRAGAMGLMQIMPATWADLRARYGLGADPFDLHDNILAGAAWLRELHDRYGSPGFLTAYNLGQARYEDHLATGRPLPAETRAYLTALEPVFGNATAPKPFIDPLAWTRAALFPLHSDSSSGAERLAITSPTDGVPNGLFLPLSGRAQRP